MKFKILTLIILCITTNQLLYAQTQDSDPRKPDMINFGPGLGFDYGGLGVNFMGYPQKNIGIFIGGGYALAGFGYNAGVKFRLSPDRGVSVNPFLTAMYGYNAAMVVTDNTQYNKLFYGPTLGVGVDIRSKRPASKGFLSIALLFPIRNSDSRDYMDFLKNTYGISFSNDLVPVGFSIGYKFILN